MLTEGRPKIDLSNVIQNLASALLPCRECIITTLFLNYSAFVEADASAVSLTNSAL